MLGSSNSIACANIMLNTAVAESLRIYADRLEHAEDFETALGIQAGSNHEKLLKMLTAVNDPSLDFRKVFHTYFDEDNYHYCRCCAAYS